ncbi:MAG: ABC transporter ATP-binding protein, partial [Candidatus Eremiobacteraeota bacterium]|nr:ABC transporter ATP-binding protein [Candidatus Eremiobacteraeota bacterium]
MRGISKRYGARVALDAVSLDVFGREPCVVLGASGAGKSTLLRVIAGVERPDSGSIEMDGHTVTTMLPQHRSASLLPSGGALFPHLTAFENLAFPLRVNGASGSIRAQVIEIAEMLRLRDHLATPARLLSAGEQQRVALGRALLRSPRMLLLDEPAAHLDPPLRETVRKSILETARDRGVPMLYVTHDHEDAFAVADRIAVLIDGRIAQLDTARAVYDKPASVEVARFVGPLPMNLFARETEVLGIRAEHIMVVQGDADLQGTVIDSALIGASRVLSVQTNAGRARVVALGSTPPAL